MVEQATTRLVAASVADRAAGRATAVAPPAGWQRLHAWFAWRTLAIGAALCAIWTLTVTGQTVYMAWEGGWMRDWLVADFTANFVCMLVAAAAMALPIAIAREFGPQDGWQRTLVVVAAVALAAAPLATGVRLAFHVVQAVLFDDGPPEPVTLPLLAELWMRYAQQAALVTCVVEFYRHEVHSIDAMRRAEIDRLALDREMTQARLQVLQAQIEPHFLFNTLANVRRLCAIELATGQRMLDDLMRYLEVALPRMREAHSTLEREVALAEAYLHIQNVRMGDRLAFHFDVPVSMRAIVLPPMMLLTLVENAIKHGLGPKPEGGRIEVRARREGARLSVTVTDDGRGFRTTSGGGTGLSNIRARLAAMYGDGAMLSLVENASGGVTSTLSLPANESGEGEP